MAFPFLHCQYPRAECINTRMKSPRPPVASLLAALLTSACVLAPARAESADLAESYHKAKGMMAELRRANAAKDDVLGEKLAREILQIPIDPTRMNGVDSHYVMAWLRDHGRLPAWVADTERQLEATPDAKQLLVYYALGTAYRSHFTFEAENHSLGRAKSPVWLRLERKGDTWTASMSHDGKDWIKKSIRWRNSDKPLRWGFASLNVPHEGANVPRAFQSWKLEPPPADDSAWILEETLPARHDIPAVPKDSAALKIRPLRTRMDNLVDAGWSLQRELKGDATLTVRLELPAQDRAAGLRVSAGPGHFAPRIYLGLDAEGTVRFSMRPHDTRGAVARLRLAQLSPDDSGPQMEAAWRLAMLGLGEEAFPFFESLMERDFVGTLLNKHHGSLISSYLHAGREEELVQHFLAWEAPPDLVKTGKAPFAAYSTFSKRLADAQKWEPALLMAHRAMALTDTLDDSYRALSLKAIDSLVGLKQKDAVPSIILDGLFGGPRSAADGPAAITPPHWAETGDFDDDAGPWSNTLALLRAAEEHQCAGEVWEIVRRIVPADSTHKLDRMDRVLAGLAARDPAVLPEWSSLIEYLKANGVNDRYFYAGAGPMLERWKRHDREAMITWLTAAGMGSDVNAEKRRETSVSGPWQGDLFMAEGAIRCALKLGDVNTARDAINMLNKRFAEHRDMALKQTDSAAAGIRILINTFDRKQPELTRLFLPTMEDMVTHAVKSGPRNAKTDLEQIKQKLGVQK
jgi:hypothetical protein